MHKILVLLLPVLVFQFAVSASQPSPHRDQVLYINSYHEGYPWSMTSAAESKRYSFLTGTKSNSTLNIWIPSDSELRISGLF